MHATNHPHWDAAQRALAAEKSAMEVLAALLGVETWDDVKARLDEQREPDLTMYLRSSVVYVLRRPDQPLERVYEGLRDAANRALPVDEAMSTINGKLRRELDTATALLRDWAADVSQDPNRQVPAPVLRFLIGEARAMINGKQPGGEG